MTWVAPFEASRYRKLVLAAVERRGGPDASDPFELYDLPVAEDLADAVVAARIEEVWAFWQKQRDHPKLGALVGRLVEGHSQRSAELLDTQRRRFAARRVLAQRSQRDEGRYRALDAAVERLVERHGAVAPDKVEGLVEFGATSGLSRDEVLDRLAGRGPSAAGGGSAAAAQPVVSEARRRQIRDLLGEFGLLNSSTPPPTLLALLDLDPAAGVAQVRARAAAWRSRAREMPPERLRAVADELMVHVAELLEPGSASISAYLDAVAADVTELVRPKVRAAVLVEDRLVADDHAHLLREAQELGLDRRRAENVLASVAAELGVPVEASGGSAQGGAAPSLVPGWYQRRRQPAAGVPAARATRPQQADPGVEAVRAEAAMQWRAAAEAMAAGRFTTALTHLEQVQRTAGDLHPPAELEALLARAREEVAAADAAVSLAVAGPAGDRAAALLEVLAGQSDHAGALAALAQLPILPPQRPVAIRPAGGAVVVRWTPSGTPDVSYKVSRLRPDGGWQVVGRSSGVSLEDGGAPPGPDPVYAVVAVQAGRFSVEARTDGPPPSGVPGVSPDQTAESSAGGSGVATGETVPAGPDAPSGLHASRAGAESVVVTWTAAVQPAGTGDPEYRVRCQGADGRWRVVGRTRDTTIEDGGAGPGELGVYAVSAAVAGVRSAEALSTSG